MRGALAIFVVSNRRRRQVLVKQLFRAGSHRGISVGLESAVTSTPGWRRCVIRVSAVTGNEVGKLGDRDKLALRIAAGNWRSMLSTVPRCHDRDAHARMRFKGGQALLAGMYAWAALRGSA